MLDISAAAEFEEAAMEVFRFQAERCAPYRDYLAAAEIDPEAVAGIGEIPFLPIELFRSRRVYCGEGGPETVFTSSGTGSAAAAKHYVASLSDYQKTYTRAFELFYGPVGGWSIYALLPSYLEREGSSLVRMADGLISKARAGGFYLYDHDRLLADMAADGGRKILLGVSYALLDLAEKGVKLPPGTVVMETGGMKGRRGELSRGVLHAALTEAFGVERVESEYGMAELMSQAYSRGGGIFRTPPWMRVSVRDPNDPFDVRPAGRGALDIIDLANVYSCAFIATQDLGTVADDGGFTVDGRAERSAIRGCNLLVQ